MNEIVSSTSTSASTWLRLILLQELAHIRRWRKTAIKGNDPEGVHQVRVSLRRMRTALSIYKPIIPPQQHRKLSKNLKKFAHTLDKARDLDVFITNHLHDDAEVPDSLRKAITAERQQAYKPVRKLLKGKRFKQYLRSSKKRLKKKKWRKKVVAASYTFGLEDFAANTLELLRLNILEHSDHLDLADEAALHQLRIDCKKLRYASEFFSTLYEPITAEPFIKQLKQLQDTLGGIHDCHVHNQMRDELSAETDTEANNALNSIIHTSEQQSQRLKQHLLEDLHAFTAAPLPWR